MIKFSQILKEQISTSGINEKAFSIRATKFGEQSPEIKWKFKIIESIKEQKQPPAKFFTKDYLQKRVLGKHPKTLYHFTDLRKGKFNINNKLIKNLHGSGVSLTENPAMAGPGPVCFVVDSDCIEKLGYTIVPYVYGSTYLREAEWVVTKDPEYYGEENRPFTTSEISIPSSCWKKVSITTSTNKDALEFKEYAESKGFEVSFLDWKEEWNLKEAANKADIVNEYESRQEVKKALTLIRKNEISICQSGFANAKKKIAKLLNISDKEYETFVLTPEYIYACKKICAKYNKEDCAHLIKQLMAK